MRITITCTIDDDQQIQFELDYEVVADIFSRMPDTASNTRIFAALAKHPSSDVRQRIAPKGNLDDQTLNILAADREVSVLDALLDSPKANKSLNTEQALYILSKDSSLAARLAGNIESFESIDINKLCSALVSHADPVVRSTLASNFNTPKKHLRKLTSDEDPRVSSNAKTVLEAL